MNGTRLLDFDRDRGRRIAGTDEAGRGCLAGPIVAGGVLFDYDAIGPDDLATLQMLNDSKRLSCTRREQLFGEIMRIATAVVVVSRSAAYIDDHGLHRTNLHCLGTALERVGNGRGGLGRVSAEADALLSDGYMPFGLDRPCEAVVRGDATSAAVAAASIVAKVSRDRYMRAFGTQFPEYGFESHVGYATRQHREAIAHHGPTAIHRRSFASDAYEQFQLVA